jgi:hypothetical protein
VPRILVMAHVQAICRLRDKPLEDFIGSESYNDYVKYLHTLYGGKEEREK